MPFNQNSGYGQAMFASVHGIKPTTGNIMIVADSSNANFNAIDEMYTPDGNGLVRRYSTLDAAVSAATANTGDVILVAPGHAETVTATSIDLDVAGVTIVNLGEGAEAPTYTFSATGSTITVDAANVKWIGGIFKATVLDVASAFTVGAATTFTLDGGLFIDTSAILNFLSIVTTGATDNEADDLTVTNNTWYGLNLATPLAFLSILAAESRPSFTNNKMFHKATSGAEMITLAAKIVTGADFTDNIQVVVGATGTTTGIFLTGSGTTSTGIVKGNFVSSLDTTSELLATAGTGLVYHENYYTGVADKSGKLWPVVDAA